jgi:hypothetical protein
VTCRNQRGVKIPVPAIARTYSATLAQTGARPDTGDDISNAVTAAAETPRRSAAEIKLDIIPSILPAGAGLDSTLGWSS